MTDVTERPTLRVKMWWPERVNQLKAEWAEGVSCTQIAAGLGRPYVSRNAVIGKVHRLNLPGRKTDERKPYVAPNRPRRRSPKNVEVSLNTRVKDRRRGQETLPVDMALDEFNAQIPVEQRKTLFELTHWTCRWPVGNPGETGFFFCGGLPTVGYQYCSGHCGFAHQETRGLTRTWR